MPRNNFLAAGACFVLLLIHLAIASTRTQAATSVRAGRAAVDLAADEATLAHPAAHVRQEKDPDPYGALPERFEGPDVSRPFGERRESFRPGVWTTFCREIRDQGARLVIVQARGSRTPNPYADLLLRGARETGLATAAYVFLNFDRPSEPGDRQVRAALNAIRDEAKHLAFFVVDVENGNAGHMSAAERVNRIGQAVDAVVRAGLKPVIYAKNTGGHNGEWSDLTGGATDFSYLPLWVPRYDCLPYLDCDGGPGQAWEPFGGWQERAGKQYNGDVRSFTSIALEGVDNSVFDHSILEGRTVSHAYNVTPLVKIQQGTIACDSKTGEITSAVRVTNKSRSTIYGPVSLAVTCTEGEVALTNATGTVTRGDAAQRPYLQVTTKPLPPGASARVVLRFETRDDEVVNPHLCVLAGSGDR